MNSTECNKLMPMQRRQMGSARAVHYLPHYSVLSLSRRCHQSRCEVSRRVTLFDADAAVLTLSLATSVSMSALPSTGRCSCAMRCLISSACSSRCIAVGT